MMCRKYLMCMLCRGIISKSMSWLCVFDNYGFVELAIDVNPPMYSRPFWFFFSCFCCNWRVFFSIILCVFFFALYRVFNFFPIRCWSYGILCASILAVDTQKTQNSCRYMHIHSVKTRRVEQWLDQKLQELCVRGMNNLEFISELNGEKTQQACIWVCSRAPTSVCARACVCGRFRLA